MNEEFKQDYRDICLLLLGSRTIEEVETAAYYAVAMCDEIGYDADGIEMKSGTITNELPPLVEALWSGFGDAMRASAVRLDSWRVFTVRNGSGRLLSAKLMEAGRLESFVPVMLETDIDAQLKRLERQHDELTRYSKRRIKPL